jgi:HAD superfamily hydrolase (TIGR01509 family)
MACHTPAALATLWHHPVWCFPALAACPFMTSPIAALLFDLDGTLVDSEKAGLDVLHEMACALGADWSREASHARFRGVPMPLCVADLAKQLPHLQLDQAAFLKELRSAMAARFRESLVEIPGASALLQSLQIPFAVATNGPREKASLTLGLTGLERWLQGRVFCAPEVGSYKPEPGLFLHAARALGCEPTQCAVVEDSLPGLRAGLAAGMRVFSLHPREGLPEDIAQRVVFIAQLADLKPWL